MDSLCTNIRGCPEGCGPFGSGCPIGVSSIPVGTRLSRESRVCYTFVAQITAGAVAHPGKCGYSCGVLAEKVAPYRAAQVTGKGWQAVRRRTVCSVPLHAGHKNTAIEKLLIQALGNAAVGICPAGFSSSGRSMSPRSMPRLSGLPARP